MNAELKKLVERRREVVQQFIDQNADLFAPTKDELDSIEADSGDDDDLDRGPFVITEWLLISSSQSLNDPEYQLVASLRAPGMPYSHELGLMERIK